MVRSWDARVKGASQKVARPLVDAAETNLSVEDIPGDVETPVDQPERRRSTAGAVEDDHRLPVEPSTSGIADATDGQPRIAMLAAGMALAVDALEVPMVVIERSSGRVEFASSRWIERFGAKTTWARHMPSATESGESPLPPPGQSWQRTRSLMFADQSEDLAELMMLGDLTVDGDQIVTIIALNRTGTGPAVTDRAEIISILDGALGDGAPGSVAVLYVDLDRFKVVHDLVGNIEAVRLLDLVSRRIAASVRSGDLMFRLPSDEFVVIATDLEHPSVAEELAERVRGCVATLADVGHDLALTASVGVAVADDHDVTGDSLLSAGETAVYLAKGRGRNRVAVHDEELRTRSQRLLVVERQLRKAIEQRDVRFAYQPVVHLPTGSVVGAEALLRLGGDIGLSAVEVVAAAEHSGLMGTLGSLVFHGVDEQLGDLLRAPNDHHLLMVNLSATQLADDGLLETLADIVHDRSIPNGRFAVEVPEVVIRQHHEAFRRMCEMLRPRFQLGIDGFGTNVASLDVLDGLPIDYVKLHRSLTTSIGADRETRERLADLVASAVERNIAVIALGVERMDQAVALAQLGCTMAQGFLYAGAVTAEDLKVLMTQSFEPVKESHLH